MHVILNERKKSADFEHNINTACYFLLQTYTFFLLFLFGAFFRKKKNS